MTKSRFQKIARIKTLSQNRAIGNIVQAVRAEIQEIPSLRFDRRQFNDPQAAIDARREAAQRREEVATRRRENMGVTRARRDLRPSVMRSSNVAGYGYDESTEKCVITFHGGSMYEYSHVSLTEWLHLIVGDATCRTSGQNAYGRWWRGKSPSVGAAVHKYLIRGGKPYRKLH